MTRLLKCRRAGAAVRGVRLGSMAFQPEPL
ncbi:Uncharacterised protein [Bordetella pertussis]|nr:Uncharacterised protein [Bordetella pertussis]